MFKWIIILVGLALCDDDEPSSGGDDVLSPEDERLLRNGKISLICVVGVATLLASLLPWVLGKFQKAFFYVNLGNCFTAGVLLGAALCHMTPTSLDGFDTYFKAVGPVGLLSPDDVKYPFNEFIAGCSFFLLLLIDRGLMQHNHAVEVQKQANRAESNGTIVNEEPVTTTEIMMGTEVPSNTPTSIVHNGEHFGCPVEPHTHPTDPNDHAHCPDLPHIHPSNANVSDSCPDYPHIHHESSHSSCAPFPHIHHEEIICNSDEMVKSPKADSIKSVNSIEKQRGTKDRIVAAWILCVALSLHSIFDGLSVGAENEKKGFIALTIALVAHKLLDGFAVGVGFYFAKLPIIHTAAGLIICALMTPMGIGIGWAITESSKGSRGNLARGIIVSISLGTFYFISLIELLPAGLSDGKYLVIKVLVAFLGFGLMAMLAIWV